MDYEQLVFSAHAVRRMFERRITTSDVNDVLTLGEVIAEYPEDQPFPSYLVLGLIRRRPLPVIAALDAASKRCHVITVYEPDPNLWGPDFKLRNS